MRIIAGSFRGRRLKAPKGRNTRPTPDRVREALFSILADEVVEAHVVELFGGTGSLGLEALSRGAATATFLELDRGALACLADNIEMLGVGDQTTVLSRSAFDFPRIARSSERFDLVFCDPPFRFFSEPDSRQRLQVLVSSLPLSPGALIVVEHRAGDLFGFSPPGLRLEDLRTWGTTGLAFYRPDAPAAP